MSVGEAGGDPQDGELTTCHPLLPRAPERPQQSHPWEPTLSLSLAADSPGPQGTKSLGFPPLEIRGPRRGHGSPCGSSWGPEQGSSRSSFLPVGLFQELVLIRGDADHLVPRAKWHLPSASAAELPLAHELPGQQVSEATWKS